MKRWSKVVAAGLVWCPFLIWQGACSSTSSKQTVSGSCVANQENSCQCPDGSDSRQICRADGSGYDPCVCGSGGSSGSGGGNSSGGKAGNGSGGKGGSTGSGGQAGQVGDAGAAGEGPTMTGVKRDGLLGAPCATSADCVDLDCVTTLESGGTLPGGSCSKSCIANDECPSAICIQELAGYAGYCAEPCDPGPAGSTALDSNKCHGRSDFACGPVPADATVTACVARCNIASDCNVGMCSGATGLCGLAGGPEHTGTACDPTVPNPAFCSGLCYAIDTPSGSGTDGICSEVCTIGASRACGGISATTAACLEPLTTPSGAGDAGQCMRLCYCQADCGNDVLDCIQLDTLVKGMPGYCGVLGPNDVSTSCP